MDSDVNTRLYRRFGVLRNRLLLHKQDQIVRLSTELDKLDKTDETSNPERLYCRRYDEKLGAESQRNSLLKSLGDLLRDYDELLLRENSIVCIPQPNPRNHQSLLNWVEGNKPFEADESQYIFENRDFVLLGNQHDDWMRSFQERIWDLGHNRLFGVSPVTWSEHQLIVDAETPI